MNASRKPLSLRARLVLRQSLLFSAAVIVFATVAYLIVARLQYAVVDEQLEMRSASVRSMLQLRHGTVEWLHDQADPEVKENFTRSHQFFQLLDARRNIVDASNEARLELMPVTDRSLRALDSHWPVWESVWGVGGNHLRVLNTYVSANDRGDRYVLRVAMSLADADGDCARVLTLLLIFVPVIIGIHAASTYTVVGRSLNPLSRLANAALNLSPKDLSQRLPDIHTGDEIEQVSASVNKLISDMETSFQQMREFLPNLSHELRSPLAVLRAETERALRWAKSEQEFREALNSQLEHLERMTTTMSDLLTISLSGPGSLQLQRRPENVSELAMAAVEGMRDVAAEKKVELHISASDEVIANVDAAQIWRLILNLIDNAIKYNTPGGSVEVAVTSHGDQLWLAVSDTGHGISPEELPHVFDRFYRSSNVKRMGIKGYGLGLAFAKQVAEAHGGHIEVTSTVGVGSEFRVSMPILAGVAGLDHTNDKADSIAAD